MLVLRRYGRGQRAHGPLAMQLHFQTVPSEQAFTGAADASHGSAAPGPLSFRLHERMEPLETVWRALEAENGLSLHQGYDWCRAWAESHGGRILVVEGVCAGRTHLLLPLDITRLGPLRTARLLASDFSNINTGLHTPAFRSLAASGEFGKALRQARGLFARHFDLLLLDKVPLAWRGQQSPFSALAGLRNQNASFQLPIFADFDETLAQLNAKRRRKKFRASERRIAAVGGYEHIVAEPGAEAVALLETFFRQKAARFEAMGLPDAFRSEETRNFFRALVAVPHTRETYPLRLHAVRLKGEHEGHIVAIAGMSRKGDHAICQFGSIDETVAADASPGEMLFFLIIRQLCEDGARLFDFGIGDQPYKRSWCTLETAQHDLFWAASTAGQAAAALHRMKTGAKRLIKQNTAVYSFVQRLRSGRQQPAPADAETD